MRFTQQIAPHFFLLTNTSTLTKMGLMRGLNTAKLTDEYMIAKKSEKNRPPVIFLYSSDKILQHELHFNVNGKTDKQKSTNAGLQLELHSNSNLFPYFLCMTLLRMHSNKCIIVPSIPAYKITSCLAVLISANQSRDTGK